MPIRIPWDEQETALLISACVDVNLGKITKKAAVTELSKKLRKRAINKGLTIDSIFRNENGITMQFMLINELITNEKSGLHGASKLFVRMVEMYKKDINAFENILKEAREMCNESINIQDLYSKWLSEQLSPAKMSEIFVTYYDIDEYFQKEGLLKTSLLETTKLDMIDKVLKKLQMSHRYSNKYVKAVELYRDWLLQNEQLFSVKIQDTESEDKIESNAALDNRRKRIDDSHEEDIQIVTFDDKKEYATLYMRLKSMASVYDDAHGYNIEWIKSMLGNSIDTEKLKSVLDHITWITEVAEEVYSFSKNAKPLEQVIEFDKELFVRVLMIRYRNGMRFDSIDFDNFRETYADIIGKEINFTDKELEMCLRKCGVLYQGRLFPAEGIVNSNARERLMEYITGSFASGKQVLYYKSIYSDLSDIFADCFNLTDEKMLKPYLEYVCKLDEYYFAEDYMTNEKNVKINHSSEIEEFLLSMGKPLSYADIYAGLSHVSKDVIYNEIKSNSNIVLNEKKHYYHYGIFEFSLEDADIISGFISEDIEENGYSIWSRVFLKIQQNMPLFIENNAYLSPIGIRNAVSKKLSGRFNFAGEVICNLGQSLNMAAVYRLYGEHKAPFSADDIYEFSKEVSDGVIYFDSLSETTVRTSRKQFVQKADVKFDVEAIDSALATYLPTGYMLIRDIDSFLVFPNVGYEWNAFLLESYLMYYSSKYALLNNGRSLNNVAGALVRRGSGYDDFVDVCADVLAASDCVLTKQKALNYLADQNLLTRRSYNRIDSAITKAKQIRNKKG